MIKAKNKKIVAMATVTALVIGVFATFAQGVSAEGVRKGDTLRRSTEKVAAKAKSKATKTVGDTFTVDGINYRVLDEDAKTVEVGYNRNSTVEDVVIPATVKRPTAASEPVDYKVVGIGEIAFGGYVEGETGNGNSYIKTLIISEGVEKIKNWAFSDCTNLTEIKLPASIKSIDGGAFAGDIGLINVDISNLTQLEALNTYCGYGNFEHCTNLKEIKLPDSIKSIKKYTFNECWSLETINFPTSLEEIGVYAFADCLNLKKVDLSDCKNLRTIESNAFSDYPSYFTGEDKTTNIDEITLPDNPDLEIGEGAVNLSPETEQIIYGWTEEIPEAVKQLMTTSELIKYASLPTIDMNDEDNIIETGTFKVKATGTLSHLVSDGNNEPEEPNVKAKATKGYNVIKESYNKVDVYLDGKLAGTTDSNGEFTVENLNNGNHTIKVVNAGGVFVEKTFEMKVPAANNDNNNNNNNSDNNNNNTDNNTDNNAEINTDASNTDKDITTTEKETVAKADTEADTKAKVDTETVETSDVTNIEIAAFVLIMAALGIMGTIAVRSRKITKK